MNATLKQDPAMPSATDRAREAILAELRPLQEQATTLREQLALAEAEQAPLEAALAALDELNKGRRKAATKGKSLCAKKTDVLAVCQSLLIDNGSLPKDDLESLAKEKLSREQGFNLSGFGLRFKECLASTAFSVSAGGVVTLAGTTTSRAVHSVVDNPTRNAIMD